MKNPTNLYVNKELIEAGDPFILRFNGKYYLYPSTCSNKHEIYCFVSTDLVNWSSGYVVCKDKVTSNAYAPEVIYYNGYFYLVTSPNGRGHYIFKSKSPLGPFKRITNNISNMIDGSFTIDKDFNLLFLRANHKGISILKMDENFNPICRKNLQADLNGWTEGPSITYRNNRYYLTYVGNHLESKGYRVCYSVSKEIDSHYEQPLYNPLLIKTIDEYNCLGHSSTVLAPDLDGYYIAYHHLVMVFDDNKKHLYNLRNVGLDRLHFNGSMLTTSPSFFEVESPKMPDLYEDLSASKNNFEIINKFILSKEETNKTFTAEFNFKYKTKIVLSYKDINNYSFILLKDYLLKVYNVKNNKRTLINTSKLPITFDCFRNIRIINKEDEAEILIDNVSVAKVIPFLNGKIGYGKLNSVYFTAFTNKVLGESDKEYANIIPGNIDCLHSLENKKYSLDDDDINYVILSENETVSFKVKSYLKQKYHLAILCKCDEECEVLLKSNNDEISCSLKAINNEYKYIFKDLGILNINENDLITLKVIKGSISYKALYVEQFINKEINENDIKLVNLDTNTIECDFKFNKFSDDSYFGLVFNAINYSKHDCNPSPSFCGYLVGFKNSLAVVDGINYGSERIYDVPQDIKVNKTYHLKATIQNSICEVFLDNKKIISTTLIHPYTYGLKGIYVNSHADVVVKNFKGGKL